MNKETELLLSYENEKTKIKSLLSQIENIRSMLISILGIIFSLQSYMSAGLENEKVVSVAQSLIDSIT